MTCERVERGGGGYARTGPLEVESGGGGVALFRLSRHDEHVRPVRHQPARDHQPDAAATPCTVGLTSKWSCLAWCLKNLSPVTSREPGARRRGVQWDSAGVKVVSQGTPGPPPVLPPSYDDGKGGSRACDQCSLALHVEEVLYGQSHRAGPNPKLQDRTFAGPAPDEGGC